MKKVIFLSVLIFLLSSCGASKTISNKNIHSSTGLVGHGNEIPKPHKNYLLD